MLVLLHIEKIELGHERVISDQFRLSVRVFDRLLTVCDVIDDLFELWSLA
jgi:hypothetical protein